MILKIKAVKKEPTPKPPTILSHNKIIIALITSKKSPNVIKVTGNVRITKIGLIKILVILMQNILLIKYYQSDMNIIYYKIIYCIKLRNRLIQIYYM